MEAIILSMTPKERVNVGMIDAKRRKRIAMGSGTHVSDVNKLLKQFDEMRKMMRSLGIKNNQQAAASKKSKNKKGKNKKSSSKVKLPNFSGLLGGIGKFPFMKK